MEAMSPEHVDDRADARAQPPRTPTGLAAGAVLALALAVLAAGPAAGAPLAGSLATNRDWDASRLTRIQHQRRPKLALPQTLLAAPGDELRLEIDISGVESLPQKTFLRLRGLPGGATLSEGHPIAPGVWAVPLGSLANLRLRVPTDLAGKASLHLSLVTVDGPALAEASTALIVAPGAAATSSSAPAAKPVEPPPQTSPGPAKSNAAAAPAPVPPAPPKAAPDPEAMKRALAFKARGARSLAEGSVADARLLLERAAELGLAEAALLLGSTYDPVELRRLRTIGIPPEPDRARHWYGLARTLGSADAAARLKRLEAK